jgi:NADH:ubiquinone oxidoreductase subunit H
LTMLSFVSIIISVLVNVIYFVLFDRFIMGAVQRRSGPYIVG